MNLCCQINPCYRCESCGYGECWDHWYVTEREGSYHFNFESPRFKPGGTCPKTGKKVAPVGEEPTVWKIQ